MPSGPGALTYVLWPMAACGAAGSRAEAWSMIFPNTPNHTNLPPSIYAGPGHELPGAFSDFYLKCNMKNFVMPNKSLNFVHWE